MMVAINGGATFVIAAPEHGDRLTLSVYRGDEDRPVIEIEIPCVDAIGVAESLAAVARAGIVKNPVRSLIMARVPAVRVDDVKPDSPPGSYSYYGLREGPGRQGMIYACPCGCGQAGTLPFGPRKGGESWTFDGRIDRPTLSPSVHHIVHLPGGGTKTHWHGWLRGRGMGRLLNNVRRKNEKTQQRLRTIDG